MYASNLFLVICIYYVVHLNHSKENVTKRMRHFLLLLCSILIFTNTMATEEFVKCAAEGWEMERDIYIEEVTSIHITNNKKPTDSCMLYKPIRCTYAYVVNNYISTYARQNEALIDSCKNGGITRIRNAIPENDNPNDNYFVNPSSYCICGSQPFIAVKIASYAVAVPSMAYRTQPTNGSSYTYVDIVTKAGICNSIINTTVGTCGKNAMPPIINTDISSAIRNNIYKTYLCCFNSIKRNAFHKQVKSDLAFKWHTCFNSYAKLVGNKPRIPNIPSYLN